jgi:hypothetical protein
LVILDYPAQIERRGIMIKKHTTLLSIILILLCLTSCTPNQAPMGPNAPDDVASSGQAECLGFEGGNIGAGGLVCGGHDRYIYYRSESDHWRLYKAKPDGSAKIKVSDNVPEDINVLDGWVYYINHLDNHSINKVRTDGTEETKLVEGYCNNLYVAESGMYLDRRDQNNVPQVYRADLDGTNLTLLVPHMSVAYYFKGKVYYRNVQELGVHDIAADSKKTLAKAYTYNVAVDESGIYYWEEDKSEFRHIDLAGNTDRAILQGGDFFNYSNGTLYYMDIGSNENGPCHIINRLNIAENQTIQLIEEANEFFDFQGNWLGITFKQWNEHPETIDPSLIDEKDGGLKNGLNESVGYVYVTGEHLYMRAALRDSIIQTGKPDCIVRLDDGVTIWD